MSFSPTKVVEMNEGKQVGQTVIQDASNVPYGNSNVGAELDRINADLSDFFITRYATSATESVPANTYREFNITIPTVEGYTPIIFQNIVVNSSNSKLIEFKIKDSTSCSVVGYNTYQNEVNIYYSVKILYAKTSMVGS